MTSALGKLRDRRLEFSDGYNELYTADGAAWFALLTDLFYGCGGQDDAGSGQFRVGQREVTLVREEDSLQAVWTSSGEPIPGITGENCGEALMGVPREIFSRCGLIGPVTLPAREDGSSPAQVLSTHMKLLQNGPSGRIPALEAELEDRRHRLVLLGQLEADLRLSQKEIAELEQQADTLRAQLALCAGDQPDDGRDGFSRARVESIRRKLNEAHIPETHDIARLRSALVNIQNARKGAERARLSRDEAMQVLLRAQAPVNDSPFSGQTVESARQDAERQLPRLSPVIPGLLLAALVELGVTLALRFTTGLLSDLLCLGLLVAGGALLTFSLVRLSAHGEARKTFRTTLLRRFGTVEQEEIRRLADTYAQDMAQLEEARADLETKTAAMENLANALASNEQAILLEVRRFAPTAHDLTTADQLLRQCFTLRKQLAEAESQCKAHRDAARTGEEDETLSACAKLENRLEDIEEDLSQARAAGEQLSARITDLGTPAALHDEIDRLEQALVRLRREHEGLALALSALTPAEGTLYTRFAPELGRRIRDLFTTLAGEETTVDAPALLYLSARLAISNTVMPADRNLPLILDDALTGLSDTHRNAVINWLRAEAGHKQVIYFTSEPVETAHSDGNCEISAQQLTEEG